MGMRSIGRGRAGLESFCGVMDMLPPLTSGPYSDYNQSLCDESLAVAETNMRDAAAVLRQKHGVGPGQLLDIAVTCDGTWSRRGHVAIHGVIVVISWETGQVLDFTVMTKRCSVCSSKHDTMAAEEFDLWYSSHKDKCEVNHKGSSPAMEQTGATELFCRSCEKYGLRYTQVISDGDTKTISHLNDVVKPYGEDVTIIKHECVGHVQKRVGTRLRDAKKV